MATTIDSRLQIQSVTTYSGDDDGFGPDETVFVFPFPEVTTEDGSGTNQASKFYKAKLTIPSGTSVTLGLGDGTLTDPHGDAVDFSRIVRFVAYNAEDPEDSPGSDILIGNAAVNPWEGWTTDPGATLTLGPGDVRVFYSPIGITVNGSISSNLKFSNPNTAGTIIVYVEFLGS